MPPIRSHSATDAAPDLHVEAKRREALWQHLVARGGPTGVPASLVRDLGIFNGYRGIWFDKQQTATLATDGTGVAVGLLRTGERYADDLSADGVLYHYPVSQVPGRDASEVQAIKNASLLGLPLFVITTSPDDSASRDVYPGVVMGWDDDAQWFLIEFKPDAVPARPTSADASQPDSVPFRLFDELPDRLRVAPSRPRQQRFKFEVIRRYGRQCAVCEVRILELLQAAHIIPHGEHGSYDARNGIVLCANHHLAFDAGLFAIEPATLALECRTNGPSPADLGIDTFVLHPIREQPAEAALRWRYSDWQSKKHAAT